MSKYLLRKLEGAKEPIDFFGSDARTGVPRHESLDPRKLSQAVSIGAAR
jgi:hypothetical protein